MSIELSLYLSLSSYLSFLSFLVSVDSYLYIIFYLSTSFKRERHASTSWPFSLTKRLPPSVTNLPADFNAKSMLDTS